MIFIGVSMHRSVQALVSGFAKSKCLCGLTIPAEMHGMRFYQNYKIKDQNTRVNTCTYKDPINDTYS